MTVDGATSSAEQRVREVLHARGSRMTAPRTAVIRVLEAHSGHLSADEVHALLNVAEEVHLSTVYRTLDALTDLGVVAHVHVTTGPTRYQLAGVEPVHVHAECLSCHRLIDLPATVMDELELRLQDNHGFVLDASHVALSGRCVDCDTPN